MKNFPIHVKEGLELRPWTVQDAPTLFAVIDKNRAHLRKWLGWLDESTTVEQVLDYIAKALVEYCNEDGLDLGIWYQGQLVGGIGFHAWGGKHRKTSIGYWLSEEFQHKQIMIDSVRALVTFGFQQLNLNRIEIRCALHNDRSHRIPERLEFHYEGIIRDDEWLYTEFSDSRVYSMLKAQWPSC